MGQGGAAGVTLNLLEVSGQISAMAAGLRERRQGLWRSLELARALLARWSGAAELAFLREGALAGQGDHLQAEPLQPLGYTRAAPTPPTGYAVVGTDGSQIDLDRHSLAPCYLINVGSAVIAYGGDPAASLTSWGRLHYSDDDLYTGEGDSRVAVQGSLLDLRRTLAEQERALALCAGQPESGAPLVALMDGTLVLWRFSGREAERAAPILRAYQEGLRRFQSMGVPVCSYISRPAARDVLNLLAWMAQAEGSVPKGFTPADLEGFAGLADRMLFEGLRRGERSALLASQAPSADDERLQRIHFFYLNVGDEVARVEAPAWVVEQPELLDTVHTVVAEQCRLGWGYPVALSEAHEQAVIRGGEREAFLRMVGSALNDHGLAAALSAKRLSKNRRAV